MQTIIDFFNHPFFIVVGGATTLVAVCLFCFASFGVLKGVTPVLFRLGNSLSNRKIAIYADSGFDDLKALLVDSGLFKEKNIEKITKKSLAKGEGFSMMLVDFEDFKDDIENILGYKKDKDSLIVLAEPASIEKALMKKIGNLRNTIVVNFRGRLLNDVFSSMMTTHFKQNK